MDQPGMDANPARGQLNRKNIIFPLSPFAPARSLSTLELNHISPVLHNNATELDILSKPSS